MITFFEFVLIFSAIGIIMVDDFLKSQRIFFLMNSIEISEENAFQNENKSQYFKEMMRSEYRKKAGKDSEEMGLMTLKAFFGLMILFIIF